MIRQVLAEFDLTLYPKIALVIFLVAFAAIAWSVWTLSRRLDIAAASRMPLEDDFRISTPPAEKHEVTR